MRFTPIIPPLSILPLLEACGGAGASPNVPMGDGNAAQSGATHTDGPAPAATAGEAMLWAHLPKDAKNFVAVDFESLAGSSMGDTFPLERKFAIEVAIDPCLISILDSLVRVAITFSEDDLTAAAIETKTPANDTVECFAKERNRHTSLVNGLVAFELDKEHIAVAATPNLVLIAHKNTINERLLARPGRRNVLVDGRIAYGELSDGAPMHIPIAAASLSFASSTSLTEIMVHGTLPDKQTGADAQARFDGMRAARKLPRSIARALSLDVKGDDLTLAFRVRGNETEQRAVVADILKLAQGGVALYVSAAKNTVGRLGQSAVAWVERETLDPKTHKVHHATECPPTAPMTTAVVPKGVKVQSSARDWAAPGWQALKFEVSDPLYYSYGVDRSKDGKTCTFYAVGDLNGDGKTSRFQLQAHIIKDAKAGTLMQVDQNIQETDPDE